MFLFFFVLFSFFLVSLQQPAADPVQQHQQQPADVDNDKEDSLSDVTIYEELDNFIQQFDETMRQTAQTMGQVGQNMKGGSGGGGGGGGGKKKKKKEKSLLRQASFFSSRKKSKGKAEDLEGGELAFSGVLYKKNSNGSWKRKWCTLKGCIFSYFK